MTKFLLLAFTWLSYLNANCQVLPHEGSSLNYRLIGFSFPGEVSIPGSHYLEIASGNYDLADSFVRHTVVKIPVKNGNKLIGEVPSFGCNYTWRIATVSEKKRKYGPMHHFETSTYADVDTAVTRLRIMEAAKKYTNAYVFLDANRTLYDMNGKPVWYLPNLNEKFGGNVRDIKVTQAGTITFLADEQAYEVNYSGSLLWKGPDNGQVSGGSKEYYHHEFTRLANGHYMVLGNQFLYSNPARMKDGIVSYSKQKIDSSDQTTLFGTIIEYDAEGNVVWSWKSFDYFENSDLAKCKIVAGVEPVRMDDTHENAFYFDEQNKVVYLNFRTISRVVKIRYPEGTVIDEYGEKYKTGVAPQGNGLFCNQHACKASAIGCLFLFNNNGCNVGSLPKIKKFTEPVKKGDNLKKIWEYTCTTEPGAPSEFPMGGNVLELPGHSLFVCMGSQYSKVFIISPEKEILWSALPEKWNGEKSKWVPVSEYRASIVFDKKQMEQLIWNTESIIAHRESVVKSW